MIKPSFIPPAEIRHLRGYSGKTAYSFHIGACHSASNSMRELLSLLPKQHSIDDQSSAPKGLVSALYRSSMNATGRDGFVLITKKLSNGKYLWLRNRKKAWLLSKEEFSRLMNGFVVESSIKIYRPDNQNQTGQK